MRERNEPPRGLDALRAPFVVAPDHEQLERNDALGRFLHRLVDHPLAAAAALAQDLIALDRRE